MLNNKIQEILNNKINFQNIMEINNNLTYKNICGIWDFYKITNKIYHNKYQKPLNYTNDKKLLIKFKNLYNKYTQLQNIYKLHTVTKKDHIILFYIKKSKSLYLFLKEINKENPFKIIEIDNKIIKGDFQKILLQINNLDYNALYIASYGEINKNIVIDKSNIFIKIKEILIKDPCYKNILELTETITYTDIENIWSYIKLTNDKYKYIYGDSCNEFEYTDEELFEYRFQYRKYKLLEPLFESHCFNIYDHIILIYIRNTDEILIFLKSFDLLQLNQNPFWIIRVSKNILKGNLIEHIMLNLNYNYNNRVYISCYTNTNKKFNELPKIKIATNLNII